MNYVFNGHYLGKTNQYAIGKTEITPPHGTYSSLRLDIQHSRTVNIPAGASSIDHYDRKIYRIDFDVDGHLITAIGSSCYTRDEAYLEEIPGTAGKYVYMNVENMAGIDSWYDTHASMNAIWYWPTYSKARTVYENCGTEISFGRSIPAFKKIDSVSLYLDSKEEDHKLYIVIHAQEYGGTVMHLNYFNSITMPSVYTVEEAEGIFKHTWSWQ